MNPPKFRGHQLVWHATRRQYEADVGPVLIVAFQLYHDGPWWARAEYFGAHVTTSFAAPTPGAALRLLSRALHRVEKDIGLTLAAKPKRRRK